MAFGNRDLAVDLGTANTLVFERGRGIVVSEPSRDRGRRRPRRGLRRRRRGAPDDRPHPGHDLRHPPAAPRRDRRLRGHRADAALLPAQGAASRWSRPRVVMCVPSGVTEVETRAVEEACLSAGARQVALIEEPIAAAIGAGLEIAEPTGHMVVDIGGGTSARSRSSRWARSSSRLAAARAATTSTRRSWPTSAASANLAIGQPTAEEIKIVAGSAFPLPQTAEVEVRGRELLSGLPRTVMLDSDDIREALAEPVQTIVDAVRDTLDRRRPSCPRTSSSTGSCWRAAARCCTASPSGCSGRPRCRRGSPTRR